MIADITVTLTGSLFEWIFTGVIVVVAVVVLWLTWRAS